MADDRPKRASEVAMDPTLAPSGSEPTVSASVAVDETLAAALGSGGPQSVPVDETLPAALGSGEAYGATALSVGSAGSSAPGGSSTLPRVDASSYEMREVLGAGGMGKVV